MMSEERARRPAALRDVLSFPADVTFLTAPEDFRKEMGRFSRKGNNSFMVRGLSCETLGDDQFRLKLTGLLGGDLARLAALGQSLVMRFQSDILGHWLEGGALIVHAAGQALDYLGLIRSAPTASGLMPCRRPAK